MPGDGLSTGRNMRHTFKGNTLNYNKTALCECK